MIQRFVMLLCALALAAASTSATHQIPLSRNAPPAGPGLAGSDMGLAVLAVDDAESPSAADIALLVKAGASSDADVRRGALRALGRTEKRDVLPHLMPFLKGDMRADAVFAITQAMQGPPLTLDTAGSQVEAIQSVFINMARNEETAGPLGELARSLGRLPYDTPEQIAKTEEMLADILRLRHLRLIRRKRGDAAPAIAGALKGAELLGRLHGKLRPFSDELLSTLRGHATGRIAEVSPSERGPQSHALMAVIALRGLDEDTLDVSLRSSDAAVRRIATLALSGGASPMTGAARGDALRTALRDDDEQVRYEALRGYARQHAKSEGCQPLLEAMSDESPHVALAAIDALGDVCKGDENVVIRLTSEARTPPNVGSWHREAHALVALARIAPENAAIALTAHARHTVWQVRMYAARAAAILDDAATLEHLAGDPHDNVREATLTQLKRLKGSESETHFVSALGRSDYQLLRTAARELEKMPPSKPVGTALLEALLRVTAEKKDTSRDARLALLERLREFGHPEMQERLMPLLNDFDAKVAQEASATLNALTGRTYAPEPRPLPRPPLPLATEINYLQQYRPVLVMADGKRINVTLDTETAPLNCVRFLRLAKAGYFNNLTFHRVVPNFVIQGGSPGANEYVGDGPYVRDEISRRSHVRGALGLSTRGRDTGDAQIFINLVDNLRLDFNYTVFGSVDAEHILKVLEGDVIKEVRFVERTR